MAAFNLHPQASDIQLRRLTLRDAAELYSVVDANREHLRQWLPWVDGCTSVADSRQFVMEALNQYSRNLGFQCAIVEARRIVGIAGFHPIDWSARRAALGYWLARNCCGRGLATSSVRQLIAHAFEGYGLARVELRIAMRNHLSRKVAERLQMTPVACVENAEKLGSGWVDHVVYVVEREAWCIAAKDKII